MRAWWSGSARALCDTEPGVIVGALARRLVETHRVNHEEQIRAWHEQILCLRQALRHGVECRVLFEYPLIRLGRRIDAVLLTDRAIFVLEFKVGGQHFTKSDQEQVEDYALDLFDFHAASRTHPIIPILVATNASAATSALPLLWHHIAPVQVANGVTLKCVLDEIMDSLPVPSVPLNVDRWADAPYRPVPTIIEAATMLYQKHGVADIAASRADIGNLTRTNDAICRAIADAMTAHKYVILFVTGIPGAGKTLCGLNAVFGAESEAAFLTGNLPLVHVLREALARDAAEGGMSLRMARHRVESAVQPLLGFLRDNVPRSEAPHEHVIIFDEAQRAWDADFGKRKFGLDDSEASLFLDIMARHRDWAVIVALVGSGQEINTGEAGLASWGGALLERPAWQIWGPSHVIGHRDAARCLFDAQPSQMSIDQNLHLSVGVRHINSESAAAWIDAVLSGDAAAARKIVRETGDVPFSMTRSLDEAKASLRRLARGTRRAGLVCSADAKRLRADGLNADFPHLDQDAVANWFLNRWPDVRASDALEMPATQYACQGLELDYVGLCWGGDLLRQPGQQEWRARKFKGTKWQDVRRQEAITWQINTYRVLLTRARYHTVIYIPQGDQSDITRDPIIFDQVAAFFLAAGAHYEQPAPDMLSEAVQARLV